MALFAPTPVLPSATVSGAAADLRSAVHRGQYRLGQKALFLPALPSWEYLPYTAVRKAYVRTKTTASHGGSGAVLTSPVVVVEFEGGMRVLETRDAFELDRLTSALRVYLPGCFAVEVAEVPTLMEKG